MKRKLASGAAKSALDDAAQLTDDVVEEVAEKSVIKNPRPGSISNNLANRRIQVPTKDGRLVYRYVKMTAKDEAAYQKAIQEGYDQLIEEVPKSLSGQEKHNWIFEKLNKIRREWLDDFYKNRE